MEMIDSVKLAQVVISVYVHLLSRPDLLFKL